MDYWLIVCAGGWVGVMMVAMRMEEWSTDMES